MSAVPNVPKTADHTGRRPTRTEHSASLQEYQQAGLARAATYGNRGPLRLTPAGNLHPDIVAAYQAHGFYVFEQVIDATEIDALRHDVQNMITRAPVRPDATVDAQGRPALGQNMTRNPYRLAKPLSDPFGGTDLLGGRHPHQMAEPEAAASAPEYVPFIMYAMCEAMPSGLTLYGHPELLAVAQTLNGMDFVPFNDAIFVKQPGLGASVSWHQDGVTHWGSPDWHEHIHGFNFQVQLYGASVRNCLWVVPGTHKLGRIDIKAKIRDNDGEDTLSDAIPLVCNPGDVTLVNRQVLHGSFANSSDDLRVSLTFGFHRRDAVIGQRAALAVASERTMDADRIERRASVIAVAIDARQQRFPQEPRFNYAPFAGREDEFRSNEDTFNRVVHDYNCYDLAI